MARVIPSPSTAAARWQAAASCYAGSARRSDPDLYLAGLDQWARMYVDGTWTLEQFEAHADAMREAMFARSPQP